MYPCVFEASEGQWYQPGPPQHFRPIGILGGPLDEQVITARCLFVRRRCLFRRLRAAAVGSTHYRDRRDVFLVGRDSGAHNEVEKRSVFVVSTSDYGIDSGTDGPLKGAHHCRDRARFCVYRPRYTPVHFPITQDTVCIVHWPSPSRQTRSLFHLSPTGVRSTTCRTQLQLRYHACWL